MPDPVKPLSEEEIATLEKLEAAAAPGPWAVRACKPDHDGKGHICEVIRTAERVAVREVDDVFLAAMRNALPALLATAREAAELRKQVATLLEGWDALGCDALDARLNQFERAVKGKPDA